MASSQPHVVDEENRNLRGRGADADAAGPDASQGPTPVGFVFQGSSVCQVTAIGVTVILLYTSRACYNLFILSFSQIKNVHSFDYDWYNVSDQVSGGMTRCCLHGEQVGMR